MGSWIFALGSLSGFLSSMLSGHFLKRLDRRTILQITTLGLMFSLWGMALSQTFMLFLLFNITMAISLGVLAIIPNILVSLGSTPERKQQFLSGLHSMYGVSSFISPLLVAAVAGAHLKWQWSVGLASLGPMSLFLYSLHPSHLPHHKKPVFQESVKKVSHYGKLPLYLTLILGMYGAAEILVGTRLALFMRRVWDYDLEQSSLCMTGFFLGLLLGRLLVSFIKFKMSYQLQLTLCLLGTAVCFILGLSVHPYFFMLSGLTMGPFYPIGITWISAEFPDDLDSAFSLVVGVEAVMLSSMHLMVGKVTDLWGIEMAFRLGFGFLGMSLLMVQGFNWFKRRSNS